MAESGIFVEDVTGEKYHELCIYFLIDISNTDLLEKGNKFRLIEREHTHDFEWIEFERLQDEYIYPVFIKKKIFDLRIILCYKMSMNSEVRGYSRRLSIARRNKDGQFYWAKQLEILFCKSRKK